MNITITTQKRKEIERIQKEFEGKLSNSVILRATAQAMNGTMKKAIPKIKKEVKAEYNITSKYLGRIAKVRPRANSNSLNAGIYLNCAPIPIIGFKPKETKNGVAVSIKKGETKVFKNAFRITFKSEHVGILGRGRYSKKWVHGWDLPNGRGKRYSRTLRTNEKRNRGQITKRWAITEIRTASPFSMGVGKNVAPKVEAFIGKEVIRATRGILEAQLKKITN